MGNNGFTDALTTLEMTDDAARANWGGSWRMPTRAELEELLNNCDRTPETINGKYGWRLTSTKNGNSIFLPAAGRRRGTSIEETGSYVVYWSSSLGAGDPCAKGLFFSSRDAVSGDYSRYYGLSVRPVTD